MDFGIVSAIVLTPLLTAVAVLLAPRVTQVRWVALAGSGLTMVLTALLTWKFQAGTAQLQLVERIGWFRSLGIQYFVGVDGVSVVLVILTAIILFTGVLASWQVTHRSREFFAFLLLLVSGVLGVFVSFDLFLFFVFYEVAVLPMYLLIGVWGTGPKEASAMKLTLMLLLGSALLLVGFFALYHAAGLQTFDLLRLAEVRFEPALQKWVFPLIFVGFGVLGGLFPFHTWSPDGHAAAPTAVSMLHAGVLMKLGGYGILRIGLYLLPEGAAQWGLFFMALTTINIVYGAFGAIMQKDLKYFTAYSSVSHCGFVLFGLASLNLMGLKGAVIQMFSHGIMTGLFFALIGMVYGRTHTRMIPELGGLARVMPWLTTCFYIGGLASLGLPGLSGFIAESHIFLGGMFGNPWHDVFWTSALTIVATTSIVVTAVYVLRGLGAVFHGPVRNQAFLALSDATPWEKAATGVLVAVLVIAGVMPWLFNDLLEGALLPFLNRLPAVAAIP